MELAWKAVLEDGQTIQGQESWMGGAKRVAAALPSGVIAAIEASLSLTMARDERLFMNGYQTWTHCPEYGKASRIRGLHGLPKAIIDRYGFDRYGDYHFVPYPNRRGQTHGFSWCYLRRGDRFRLLASLNEQPGYTIFRYDANTGTMSISRDARGVKAGGPYALFDLFWAEGTEDEVFDAWFQAMGVKPPVSKKLAGYSSWYNRYGGIGEQAILADLEGCRKALQPGDVFQIDDGWEPCVGDWLSADPQKFPGGLSALVERIHAEGYLAGLWLAPFVCAERSQAYRDHPEWLLKVDGKPWRCGCNWGGFYALDIDHPEVQAYLKTVFDRVLNEWGFDLVKLDFLYGAAPFGTPRESRAGRMIRAMDILRDLCGSRLILACGVPMMPAFGRVDYCRVGCDVGLTWDDKPYMRLMHRERVSTKQSIDNSLFRRQLNGRAFLSDPDVFFLRRENIRLSPRQKNLLSAVNALTGGVLLTSDDPGQYDNQQLNEYRHIRRLFESARNIAVRQSGQKLRITYTLNGQQKEIAVK